MDIAFQLLVPGFNYDLARAGAIEPLTARPVIVHHLTLERLGTERLRLQVHCGPGTYVRSLARDIGEALGCGAHLSALRRTASGQFRVAAAVSLETLQTVVEAGELERLLLPPDEGVRDMDVALVSEGTARAIATGARPLVEPPPQGEVGRARVYSRSGEFVALARVEASGRMVAAKVFLRPSPR
jgi:tRNA pseudouridine55 synthase